MLSQNLNLVDTFFSKMSIKEFQKILELAAQKNGIDKFNTKIIDGEGQKHDLSPDVHYVLIRGLGDCNKEVEVVIKKEPHVEKQFPMSELFKNECYFHDTFWPSMRKFQNEIAGEMVFDKIPVCFGTEPTKSRKIILEYLGAQKFEILPKKTYFDSEHLEYILGQYGKFHAVCLALRKYKPASYIVHSNEFYDYLSQIPKIEFMKNSMVDIMEECVKYLKEEEEFEIVLDFEAYVKNICSIYADIVDYRGNNGVIIHGECWNKNMMFKYNKAEKTKTIEDMRFCNFFTSRNGTPVYDVSFCLYASGTEEIFGNLERYLQIYHASLSEALEKFKCEAEDLYPYKTFKEEWKEYSKFGFIMSLLMLRRQLVLPGKDIVMTEFINNPKIQHHYDKAEYKKRSLSLIKFMHTNDLL